MSGMLIVTGAGRGIGAATAKLAGARGYAVAVNFLQNEAAANSVVAEIEAAGGSALAVQGDIGIEADILRLFEIATSKLGPLTALVNNAALTGGFSRVEDIRLETIERVLAVNVTGTMLCCREAVRRMSTQHGGEGGGIVNISSTAVHQGSPGCWAHYAATKGAVNTFTRGLAREVATEGIRVNAVAPGLVDTDLHADNGAPDRVAEMAPQIPMLRGGTPEEVAEAVVWLLSDAASYTTGSILEVAGGR